MDHAVLIAKLERYGVRGLLLEWFKSYLSSRLLKVKVSTATSNVTYSKNYPITFGIAQGSCLGPLLFVIFCNDKYMLSTLGKFILFADDTTLLETHKDRRFLSYAVEHDVLLLVDWFRVNKLTLNLEKTIVIKFWPEKKESNIQLNGTDIEIPVVHTTKFLGVFLDENLKWDYHANQVYNKIQTNKQLLSLSRNFLDMPTLTKIYYAHVYSHLSYGLLVWGSMLSKSAISDLSKIQKS